MAENSRIGQNGGHLHSAQGGLALIDRGSANRGSSAARGILVRNLSQWVERALEYGIFRNELFFPLLLMDSLKSCCWKQRLIKCSTALGHPLSLTTWGLSMRAAEAYFSLSALASRVTYMKGGMAL